MIRRSSISAKLLRTNLLVSVSALLLAVIAFFSFDLLTYRQYVLESLRTEAAMVGDNSASAVLFNDPQSAHATLQTLCASGDIHAGALALRDGRTFAQFHCPGWPASVSPRPFPAAERVHTWWDGLHVLLGERIVFQGQDVGIVYLDAQLGGIGQRARRYALIATIILLVAILGAVVISAATRRRMVAPILGLAETARGVSRDKDYARRARTSPERDEVSDLIDTFNEMLNQMQQRDIALSRARDELELRVRERTAELQAANRELEAFSYTVAHDLRGPLDSISAMGFLLQQEQGDSLSAESRQLVAGLRSSVQNMSVLIDDLLHFSRATTTRMDRTEVDVAGIAREITRALQESAPGRVADFVVADLPPAFGDPSLLRVVFDNLLRNAWKYSSKRETSRIEVGSEFSGGEAVYFVRDNGAGFDPARADELFQPFQRLHSNSEFPGTGVGLATVKRIVQRHGGRIWTNAAVDGGATFYFTLGGTDADRAERIS